MSLHPHIPVDTAKRYVDLIGAERIIAEGKRAFGDGDYRWAAQILHNLVFAQPGNQDAKNLQADAYEQMGYQTEAPQWRGIFLTAARELREGTSPSPTWTKPGLSGSSAASSTPASVHPQTPSSPCPGPRPGSWASSSSPLPRNKQPRQA